MNKNEILSKLVPILSKQLSVESDQITGSSSIVDDLGADSLDTAEIAMMIQEEFGYDLKDHEMQAIKTVDDIVHILEADETVKNKN